MLWGLNCCFGLELTRTHYPAGDFLVQQSTNFQYRSVKVFGWELRACM